MPNSNIAKFKFMIVSLLVHMLGKSDVDNEDDNDTGIYRPASAGRSAGFSFPSQNTTPVPHSCPTRQNVMI